ncbi:MAG: aldo/keto reductase [Microbacteriaceae bacterium]|nr:aldo/keto reductase [Microbacteriaceae bacterium]
MGDIDFGRLGYGAANLGNLYRELTDDEAVAILEAAWDAGIRYFDTAPHYGLGLSERRLGAFLQSKGRHEFVLSTKVGRLIRPNPEGAGSLDLENDFAVPADQKRVWDLSRDGIRRSLDESRERLGIDRIDVAFVHDPERSGDVDALRSALPALAELRDAGEVGAIGVGSMSTIALTDGAESGLIDLLMVAGRLTLADQPALDRVVPACERNGVGIVNAAVFNSGLLARDNPGADARYDYAEVPPQTLTRVRRIAGVCADFHVSLPTAALHYALRDATVKTVVVGSSRPQQLLENAARIAEPVPEELWHALESEGLIPTRAPR